MHILLEGECNPRCKKGLNIKTLSYDDLIRILFSAPGVKQLSLTWIAANNIPPTSEVSDSRVTSTRAHKFSRVHLVNLAH